MAPVLNVGSQLAESEKATERKTRDSKKRERPLLENELII